MYIPPIKTITHPLTERFSSKLLVNVMKVSLAEENIVFSLIVTSLRYYYTRCMYLEFICYEKSLYDKDPLNY